MEFIVPPTGLTTDIPWEKVLPPLIPRLNGTYGYYNWSPSLLMPESNNGSSSAEVGQKGACILCTIWKLGKRLLHSFFKYIVVQICTF